MFSDVLRYSVPKSGTKRAVPPHNVKRKPLTVKDVFLPGHGNFSRRDLAMGIFLYQVPPNSSGQVQKTECRHMESSDAQSLLWQRTSRVQQGLCLTSIVRPVHSLGVSYAPLRVKPRGQSRAPFPPPFLLSVPRGAGKILPLQGLFPGPP